MSLRSITFAFLLLLACLPAVYSKGRSGGSSGGSSSSSSSSSSSGGSDDYYPEGQGYPFYQTSSGYRTDACTSSSSSEVIIVANEAYTCSEIYYCYSSTSTVYTLDGASRSCSLLIYYSAYRAKQRLSSGAIVGIVIGVVVGVSCIACCWYVSNRKKKAKLANQKQLAAVTAAQDPEQQMVKQAVVVQPAKAIQQPAQPAKPSASNQTTTAYFILTTVRVANPATSSGVKPATSSSISPLLPVTDTDYENAKAFEVSNPPPHGPIPTAQEEWDIRNRGIAAWSFVTSDPASVTTTFDVSGSNYTSRLIGPADIRIGVNFHPTQSGRDIAVLSELPLGLDPAGAATNRDFYYFEVTVEEHPQSTVISVGIATRPYPSFRMIGYNKYSVGYRSDNGQCFVNESKAGRTFGSSFSKGSVVGVGYLQGTGSVFFTLNGVLIGEATTIQERVLHPYHAAVAANGPAKLSVNYGQRPFMYPNANPAVDPVPAYRA